MKRRLGEQPIAADVAWLRVLLGKCGLAQPGGWLPFAIHAALSANISASNSAIFGVTLSRDMTIRYWIQAAYIQTTNDGSNYWTIELRRLDTHAILNSFNSSSRAASNWYRESQYGLNLVIPSSYRGLYIHVVKTGSPGNLYLMAPAVFVT